MISYPTLRISGQHLHQATRERARAVQVRPADTKKVEPTQSVSPNPGTALVSFHSEAYTCPSHHSRAQLQQTPGTWVMAMGMRDSME